VNQLCDDRAEATSATPDGLLLDGDLGNFLATVIAQGASGNAELVFRYEDAAAEHFGAPWAISMSSGTAAIYAALVALHITAGDEVVLPATAPVMSMLPILAVGATPVICDTRSEHSFGLSTDDLLTVIGPRTRAVLFVPMWGYWDEAPETLQLVDRSEAATVLDASQAHHLRLDGGLTAVTDAVCLSTHARKPLSTGEGGLLLTRHEDLAARARSTRNFGQATTRHGHRLLPSGPFGATFGLNLKLNGLGAALGLSGLGEQPADLARRRSATKQLRLALTEFDSREHISAPGVDPGLYGFCFSVPAVRRFRLAAAVTDLVEVETERYDYHVLPNAPIAAPYRRPCPNADTLVQSTCSLRLQDLTAGQARQIGARLATAAANGWPEPAIGRR
jgi:dTDP-4-amino-4,6-dideoxygalactose transaminase